MAVIAWLCFQLNTFSGDCVLTSQAEHCPRGWRANGHCPSGGCDNASGKPVVLASDVLLGCGTDSVAEWTDYPMRGFRACKGSLQE